MLGNRFHLACGLTALIFTGSAAHAQINKGNQWPNPRLNYVSPAGGKVGTTFEVGFAGTDVDEPQALIFSHPGIQGTPIIPPLPKPDPKAKAKPKAKAPVRPPVTKFNVSIGKDVPLGYYDVRLVNQKGVSNPRRFVVGGLLEVAEKEPNNDVAQAQKVEIGSTINGVIAAGTDIDYFSFTGKKGQRVVVHCLAASIDSRLDPEIKVYNAQDVELASYRPLPLQDGLIDVTLPADGDYSVRLSKFTYTVGNAEYFYRLNIAATPYIDAVFPPMIEPGKSAQVTLYGRNLPGGKLDPTATIHGHPLEKMTVNITAPGDAASRGKLQFTGLVTPLVAGLDGFEYRLKSGAGVSNPVLLTYAKAPVVLENDANDTPDKAQAVRVPCEIAGRIDKPRDRDWYVFDAKKGDVLMIEVISHRLGAETDMYFVLKNLATKQDITTQDDNPDSASLRFFTANNRDPAPYRFVAPADGKYHLMLASHTGDNYADATHVYRVRITKEMPDFRLFVMPSDESRPDTCRPGQGGTDFYTVYVQRLDGFKGAVTLTMDGLPAGVTCLPQTLAGSLRFTQLVVSAADNAAAFTGPVRVQGTAVIDGKKVIHQARPATVTWAVQPQQNIATITRLDQELMLAVRAKAPGKLATNMDKAVVSMGDKIDVPLKLTRSLPEFKANFQVTPVPGDMPAGMTFANLTFAPGKDDLKAKLSIGGNVQPGTYNVTFRGFANIPSGGAKGKGLNTILISTPVQVTVLPKQVATLSLSPATPTIKTGNQGVFTLKVARQYDYADAFKVQLVLPANAKGISADPITIAPGQSDAKLLIRVAAGTPPANVQNLVLRATAVVNGNVTLTHELKFNVVIAK